jgi:hypothetical protein
LSLRLHKLVSEIERIEDKRRRGEVRRRKEILV